MPSFELFDHQVHMWWVGINAEVKCKSNKKLELYIKKKIKSKTPRFLNCGLIDIGTMSL